MESSQMRLVRFFTSDEDMKNSIVTKTIRTTDIRQAAMTERILY